MSTGEGRWNETGNDRTLKKAELRSGNGRRVTEAGVQSGNM